MRRPTKGAKFSDTKQLISSRSLSVLTWWDSMASTTHSSAVNNRPFLKQGRR